MNRQGSVLCSEVFLASDACRILFAVLKPDARIPLENGVTEIRGKSPLFDLVVGDDVYPRYVAKFDKRNGITFERLEE